jgi:DNA-binding transcriptional ArsR family regulator
MSTKAKPTRAKGRSRRKGASREETSTGLDPRVIKALGHPLRQSILLILNERVASPMEIARQLDEPIGNVAYHTKTLERLGMVELVKTEPARGATEHFYRAAARPLLDDQHWAQLPLSVRRELFDGTLQRIWDHTVAAAAGDGFDDDRAHVSWTKLELDDQAYDELADELAAMLDRAMEIHAEAAARLAAVPAEEREAQKTELAIMHFDRASDLVQDRNGDG